MSNLRSEARPGRNNCISSRITDVEDVFIDTIAEKEDKTRSQIVSEAIGDYLEKKKIGVEKDESDRS